MKKVGAYLDNNFPEEINVTCCLFKLTHMRPTNGQSTMIDPYYATGLAWSKDGSTEDFNPFDPVCSDLRHEPSRLHVATTEIIKSFLNNLIDGVVGNEFLLDAVKRLETYVSAVLRNGVKYSHADNVFLADLIAISRGLIGFIKPESVQLADFIEIKSDIELVMNPIKESSGRGALKVISDSLQLDPSVGPIAGQFSHAFLHYVQNQDGIAKLLGLMEEHPGDCDDWGNDLEEDIEDFQEAVKNHFCDSLRNRGDVQERLRLNDCQYGGIVGPCRRRGWRRRKRERLSCTFRDVVGFLPVE